MLFMEFLSGAVIGGLMVYIIFHQKHLKEKSNLYTDQLTGLKNSYYFENVIEKYLKKNVSFLLLDIDNFKVFNTRFGYEETDGLLKQFVQKLAALLPAHAAFIRYKFGDEFLVILPGSEKDLSQIAGLMTEIMTNTLFTVNEDKVSIKFSSGITSFNNGDTQQTIISRLTTLLIEEKKSKVNP